MAKKTQTQFQVLKDTREKDGWDFPEDTFCKGTILTTIKTGDYAIKGLEDIACIERKGSIAEFAHNITEDRFERQLERMKEFPHAFIILEFDMFDIINYPNSAKLPPWVKNKIKMKGDAILSKFMEYQIKYGVNIILAGFDGDKVAYRLFKKLCATYPEKLPNE